MFPTLIRLIIETISNNIDFKNHVNEKTLLKVKKLDL